MRKPILCLDFDGVIHSYESGWKGADTITDPPVPGAIDFIEQALDHFDVSIYSSRSGQPGGIDAMKAWLMAHTFERHGCVFAGAPKDLERAFKVINGVSWPETKPAAFISIDDRAVQFTGHWPSIKSLQEFKPWNKH